MAEASDESDIDPDFDSTKNPAAADINDNSTYASESSEATDNDEDQQSSEEEPSIAQSRPRRSDQRRKDAALERRRLRCASSVFPDTRAPEPRGKI